jgi:hypothetical protein
MILTEAQRRAWVTLSPNKRRILVSHRRDEFEQEFATYVSIMTALENVFGPRIWEVKTADLAEGEVENETELNSWKHECEPAMTYEEIGKEIGLSRDRVRHIEQIALKKLRRLTNEELKAARSDWL